MAEKKKNQDKWEKNYARAKSGQNKLNGPRKSSREKQEFVKEHVAEARKQAVDVILELMEEKGLAWACEWDGSQFMPRNGKEDRPYNGRNRIHLMAKAYRMGYEDSRWFTFKQAEEAGYHPNKGEKATVIEFWKQDSFMVDADGNITHDREEAEGRISIPRLVRYYNVFNAEQLIDSEGNQMPPEEPRTAATLDAELAETADKLIETSRCDVREDKFNAQAYYSPSADYIAMPDRRGFRDMEGFITTLAHEMAHSTMKPLGRTEAEGNRFGSEGYAREELVAELGSTFACIDLGIHRSAEFEMDENFKNHAAYLKSWQKKLASDPDELFKAATKASEAANYIIDRYEGREPEADRKIRERRQKSLVPVPSMPKERSSPAQDARRVGEIHHANQAVSRERAAVR